MLWLVVRLAWERVVVCSCDLVVGEMVEPVADGDGLLVAVWALVVEVVVELMPAVAVVPAVPLVLVSELVAMVPLLVLVGLLDVVIGRLVLALSL